MVEGSPPNEWYISVTTALQSAQPPKLLKWMKETNGKKQEQVLQQRSEEGTSFHDLVEADLRGQNVTATDEQRRGFDAWLALKSEHNISGEETEVSVYSDLWGYAGTFDIIGQVDGERCIMDIKTGYLSEKAGWQLAAYRYALMSLGEPNLGMIGIQLRADGRSKLVRYTHYDWCFSRFLDCLGAWRGFNFYKLNNINWRWLHTERPLTPQ